MNLSKEPRLSTCSSGQALVETAIVLPVLLSIIFNVINISYFILVALNMAATPRSAIEYSIMGFSSAGGLAGLPDATPATSNNTVARLIYADMAGALGSYTQAKVQVCSAAVLVSGSGVNGSGTSQKSNCVTCTSQSACGSPTTTGNPLPLSDPEAPYFVLNRVDITYTFKPLVSGAIFNLAALPTSICTGGTCTFHRQVSMRAMN